MTGNRDGWRTENRGWRIENSAKDAQAHAQKSPLVTVTAFSFHTVGAGEVRKKKKKKRGGGRWMGVSFDLRIETQNREA